MASLKYRPWLILVALLILGGCSSAPRLNADTAYSEDLVELNLIYWPGLSRAALDEVVRYYERRHQHVIIRVRQIEPHQVIVDGRYNAELIMDADLAILPHRIAESFVEDGLLRDLSNLQVPPLDSLIAPQWEELSLWEGVRFSVPIELTPTMLLIAEDALRGAGLQTPPPDWTLEDFEHLLIQLKAAGKEVNLSPAVLLEPMLGAFGGRLSDPLTDSWALDSPESREGLAFMARLAQQGLIPAEEPAQLVIMVGGPGAPALTALPSGVWASARNSVMQPYPRGPHGRAMPVSANVMVVPAATAYPELAVDFLQVLLNDDQAQTALARNGLRPVKDSTDALSAWRERVGDRMVQATELALDGGYVSRNTPAINIIEHLSPYLKGEQPLEQVLANLPDTVEKLPSR